MVSDFIDEYLNNQSNQAKLKLEQREWTPKGYFELNGEHAGIIVQDFEFPVYGYTIVLGFKLFEKLKNSAIRSSPLYSFRGQNGHGVSAFMEDNVLVLRTYGASGQVKTLNVELLEQVDEYKFIKLAVVHKRHRLYKDSIQVMVNGCIVCSQNLVYPDTRYMRNGHRCLGCAPGYHGMHGLLGFPTMIKGGLEMNTVLNIVQTSWNGDLNDEKLEYCFKYSANLVDLNHSVCYDAANLKQHGWIEPGTVPKIASVIAMDESIACYGGAAWVLLVAFQKCEKHNFDPFFSTLDLCAILLKKERAIQMEFVRYYGVESLLYILLQVPKETWTMQAICSIKNFIDAFYDELDTTYLGFGYRKAVHLILYNTELWLDVSVEVVHFVYKSWIPLACQRDTNCPSELKFSISHLCCISRTLSKSNMDTTSIAHLLLPMVFQPGQTNQLQELLYFIKLRCDEMDSHDQGTDICGILEALLMHLDKTEILQECSSDICSKNTNDQHSISHDKSLISNIERNGGIHFLWKLLACNVDEVTFKSLALLYRLADCVTMSPLDLGLKLSNCLVYSDAILDIAALLLNAPSKLLAATIFSAIAILLNTKNRNKEIFCKVANKLESIHLFSVQGSILTSRNSGQVRLLVLKLEDLAELLTTPSIGSEVRSNVLRITTSIVHLALLYLMDGWKYYVFVLSYLASNSCFNNVSSLAKHIYHGCIVLSPLSSYTDEEHRKLHFWPNLLQCSVFTTFLANRKEILSDATDDDVQIYLHHAVLLWKLVNSRLESTLEVALNNASEDARINGPVNCYSTMFLSSCHHIRLHSLQSAIMFLWFVVGKHSCDYNAVNSCVRQLRSFLEILSEENANCGPQMSSAPKSWYSMYTLQELFNSIERVVAVPANVKPLLKLIAVIAIDTAVDLPPSSPFVPKLLGITSMDISQITLNFPRDASSETNSLVQSWIAESQRTITDYMDSVNLETFDDVFTISDLKWQSTQSDSRAVKAWTKSTNTLIADRLQYIEEDIVSKTCWKNDFSHLDLHFEFLRVDGRVLYRLFEKQWRHLFPNIKVSDDEQNKNLHQLTRTCPSMQKYHFKAKPKPAKLAKLKPCEVLQREKQKTRLLSLKSWCSDGISEEATILADDALRAVVASTSIAASAQAESDSSSESLSDVENCIPDEPCPPNSGNRFGLIASGMAQMVDKAVQDVKYAMDTSASHLGLGDDGCREFANLPNSNQCRVGSEYGFASTKLAIGIFRNLGNLKLKQIIECASIELITAKCNYFGKLCVFKNYILFEAKGTKTLDSEQLTDCSGSSVSKFWVWQIPNINSMFPRRYLLRNSALEIFVGSKAYFLYFSNGVDDFCRIYKSIIAQQPPFLHHFPYLRKIRTAPNLYQHNTKLTKKWVKHEISTFDYLMELNSIAGRTYNDLTQYPVFPWILMDYTSNMLDLTRASSFRDLSLPIGAHAPERFAKYAERYEQLIDSDIPAFMYGSHYSHLGAVLFYLIRLEPFTTFAVQLQGGKLDHPDRLFHSVQEAWSNCLSDFSDVKELTPEWYYLPQFLSNCNDVDFGKRQDGVVVNDVILPSWASDRYDFIHKHRMALESDYVSQHIHQWIDLIFGYKQRGEASVEAKNVFFHLTYEGTIDIDSIQDEVLQKSMEAQIAHFGQTPPQLLLDHHPTRSLSSSNLIVPQTLALHPTRVITICYNNRNSQVIAISECGRMGTSIVSDNELCHAQSQPLLPFVRLGSPSLKSCFVMLNGFYLVVKNKQFGLVTVISTTDTNKHQSIRHHHTDASIMCQSYPNGLYFGIGTTQGIFAIWQVQREFSLISETMNAIRKRPFQMVRHDPNVADIVLLGHTSPISTIYINESLHIALSVSESSKCLLHDISNSSYLRQLHLPNVDHTILNGVITSTAYIVLEMSNLQLLSFHLDGTLLHSISLHSPLVSLFCKHNSILTATKQAIVARDPYHLQVTRTLIDTDQLPAPISSSYMYRDSLFVGLSNGAIMYCP